MSLWCAVNCNAIGGSEVWGPTMLGGHELRWYVPLTMLNVLLVRPWPITCDWSIWTFCNFHDLWMKITMQCFSWITLRNGQRYYQLTRYLEVRLLLEQIVSRHGVPLEATSNRGRAFLSGWWIEVERLFGFNKLNASAYHLQTDGFVEQFDRTLLAIWQRLLSSVDMIWVGTYIIFAYQTIRQQSTVESPFFCCMDLRLPVEAVLSRKKTRNMVNLKEYGSELVTWMFKAWDLARKSVVKAQK